MTLGWHIGNLDGERFFYKEGGGGGFHCMMRLYPGDRVGTVVMTNAIFDVARLLDAIDPARFRQSATSADEHRGMPSNMDLLTHLIG